MATKPTGTKTDGARSAKPAPRRSLTERVAQNDALFGTPGESHGVQFFYPRLDEVQSNPENARRHFDPERLEELAASIRQHGVIQPVTVRRAEGEGGASYQIVAGERRFRASRLAGKTHIPALLVTDRQNTTLSLIENLQREDLSPIEEALGIQHLMETEQLTQGAVAERIGRSRTAVSKTLGLLALPDEIKRAVLEGADVSKSQLLELVGLPPREQKALWGYISQGKTVQQIRALKNTGAAPVRKSAAPLPTVSYIQQAATRISRLPARVGSTTGEERRQVVAELERLLESVQQVLATLK